MLHTKTNMWKEETSLEKLTTLAIEAATASEWEQAEKINKRILSLAAYDVEALNRLARAQVCAGNVLRAEKTYKKVLEIDPYNLIAKKNIEKLSKMEKSSGHNGHASSNGNGNQSSATNFTSFFLYEPGKTKIINLLNLAPPSIIAALNCGQRLALNLKKHGIGISTEDGSYLGALPDDLAHRLLAYIAGGNQYEVYVKFATAKNLTIFIKETLRSAKFANQPSFQSATKF